MPKKPKKIHSSGTKVDAQTQQNKSWIKKHGEFESVAKKKYPEIAHKAVDYADRKQIPSKSSIARAEKEGRYKKQK
jgi:hypothetical protein